jgi:hypothetical protein
VGEERHHLAILQRLEGGAKGAFRLPLAVDRDAAGGAEQPGQAEAVVLLAGDNKAQAPFAGGDQQKGIEPGDMVGHHDRRAALRQVERVALQAVVAAADDAAQTIDTIDPGTAPVHFAGAAAKAPQPDGK